MTRKILTYAAPLAMAIMVAGCSNNDDDDTGMEMPDMPPATTLDVTRCLLQKIPGTRTTVAGAVVPDTLSIDYRSPSGFPNGRELADPVFDVTLAVLFLDLDVHSPTTFFELPLNPPANDVSFRSMFPYLAPAQGSPPAASSAGSTFVFDQSADSAYVRVDRVGMPAVSTALIPSDVKTDYNDASPSDDADEIFVNDIVMTLTGLTEALADDLTNAGLTPCAATS